MNIRRFVPCVFLAGLFGLVGCADGPKMAEVTGTVTLKGIPLDKILVEFWPEGNGPRSMGVTDAQGLFTLTTDDGKRKGAAVGPHKVVLRDAGVLGDEFLGRVGENVDMTKGKKPRLSNVYDDPHKTPVRKEVTAGKCIIDLDLQTP